MEHVTNPISEVLHQLNGGANLGGIPLPTLATDPPLSTFQAAPVPRWAWGLLALIIITGIALRAYLQFGTPLAPGINGAYYFVQVRALLEHGSEGIPDLPLVFFVQAALAWLLEHVARIAHENAIIDAVKTVDSVLPPLVALPIAWLGWRWQGRGGVMTWGALAPAAIVACGSQALRMVGDFQKNSLGLVWLGCLAAAAHYYVEKPCRARAWWVLAALGLCCLTHVGVFGSALVFAFALTVMAAITLGRSGAWPLVRLCLWGLLVVAAAAAVVALAFDPARMVRLSKALLQPETFVGGHDGPGGMGRPGGPMPGGGPPGGAAFHPPGPGMGPPGFGPPGAFGWLRWLPGGLFLTLGLFTVWTAWRFRAQLTPCDRVVGVAAALTAATLGGPFFDMDKSMRLMLIAMIPGVVAFSFLMASLDRYWRIALGGLALLVTAAGTTLQMQHRSFSMISPASYEELKSLAQFATPSEQCLVVAHHGLEWWAAWALHTHIAQPTALHPEDWTKFQKVLYLNENRREFMGGPPGGRPDGPGGGFPGGPPPFGDGPPPGGPPGGGPGGHRGNPMASAVIPPDAEILHDGTYYKLAWVRREPPPNSANAK